MSKTKSLSYYIKTYGCQANIADSNRIAGILEALGIENYTPQGTFANENEELTTIFEKSDVVVINSCSVRQKSEDKVYGLGKIVKFLTDHNKKKPFVILAGCVVGSVTGDRPRYEFSELQNKTPWVDLYLSSSQINELPILLQNHNLLSDWAVKKLDISNVESKISEKKHAYVNISHGCDNFCRFCVVPFARGKELSRTPEEIKKEVSRILSRGISEITLCGQNVNSWGLSVEEKFKIRTGSAQKLPFAQLLRDLVELPGLCKLSFISSNPFDFTQDLIDVLKHPKISNYLHIAVQSGNNDVLAKMNRRHTIEEFEDLIKKIRIARPTIELGTDLIVGFPGETEDQFLDTVKLVEKIRFNVAYIAMYSPRKGTPAQIMYKDDIDKKEKKRRSDILTKAWKKSKPLR